MINVCVCAVHTHCLRRELAPHFCFHIFVIIFMFLTFPKKTKFRAEPSDWCWRPKNIESGWLVIDTIIDKARNPHRKDLGVTRTPTRSCVCSTFHHHNWPEETMSSAIISLPLVMISLFCSSSVNSLELGSLSHISIFLPLSLSLFDIYF